MALETPTPEPMPDPMHVQDVCSLSPPALEDRLARIRRELAPHVRRREALPDGMAFTLSDAPGLRENAEAILALERVCCEGLDFRLAPLDGALRLEIRGIAPDADFFRVLDAPAPPRWRAALGAGGFGAVVAFVLFCGVPLALAAVVGGTAASTLAGLDDPRWIAAGTVGFGLLAWTLMRRRERRRPGSEAAPAETGGCGC